jgi:PTS system nitrogen regulatory IIA component
MQLTVRDAAAILNVTENTIYRWINEDNLPAHGINGQYRFSRAELLEWATLHRAQVSPNIFREDQAEETDGLDLVAALRTGGIAHNVAGSDKASVLRVVVDRLPLPEGFDREFLLQLFLAREALGATAVGQGIAIPHPRYPIILPVARPLLHLCFLAQPIDFGAANREPVHTLFVLVCPTIRMHLQMLARTACLLRDQGLRELLQRRAGAEEILASVRRVQHTLDQSSAALGESS